MPPALSGCVLRNESPALALSGTLYRALDENSPLHGMGEQDLEAADVSLALVVSGYDVVAAQTVHARKSYQHFTVRFGHRYVDVLAVAEDGWVWIDHARFHDTFECQLAGFYRRLITFSVGAAARVLEHSPDLREPADVKTQPPTATDGEHRVLQFRPRSALHSPQLRNGSLAVQPRQQETSPEPLDLSRYERPRERLSVEADDFRHRMLANIAAFAFTVALAAIGIWLAMSIADLRKTQDCMLMGRHDCVRVSTQHY